VLEASIALGIIRFWKTSDAFSETVSDSRSKFRSGRLRKRHNQHLVKTDSGSDVPPHEVVDGKSLPTTGARFENKPPPWKWV
jgi:hypothetical protein